jgi:tetratricopeptide (TPR) repeat protein
MSTRSAKPQSAAPGPSTAESILAKAQSSRAVIQDFVPLADSLEWNLGQEYLRQRGNKAFLSDATPVPFIVNNDGTLSRNAAEVFFASLLDAEERGPLEKDLFVLELGIGVGLFARFFLDAFRDLCRAHHKDWYGRLTYIAADRSQRMLLDVVRHGVLAQHPGRYRLRLIDAMQPASKLPHDLMFQGHPGPPLRAVFLNYLLDCLPAAVLEIKGEQIKQLCVRTCLARNIKLADHTDMTLGMLQQRARSAEVRARQELLEVYGLFASEYDYRPVELARVPHGEFAVGFARYRLKRVLHNYGAIQCLERLLGLLHEQGFILINDYGQTQKAEVEDFEHQRFSLTTAMGLNFPLLRAFFEPQKQWRWLEPMGESDSIHARLLGHKPAHETEVRFLEAFGKAARDKMDEPVTKARECARVGRFELAADLYREGVKRQPYNWVLLNEVANFLIYMLRDVKAGLDMAKLALRVNPACASDVWATLGDGLYEYGRMEEALRAYGRALELNTNDVRARYGIAWVHVQKRDYAAALTMIAEAFSVDSRGESFERLLKKQQEVLVRLAQQHQREYLLLTNLVSRHAKVESVNPTGMETTAGQGSASPI